MAIPLKQFIKPFVPMSLRLASQEVRRFFERRRHRFKYARLLLSDMGDVLLRRRLDLMPPKRLIYMIGGNFEGVGQTFLNELCEKTGLRPDERVLDVGCGVGRMAVPLTRYLSSRGSYEGFDAWQAGVRWCQKHITPQYPNFRFRFADLHNKFYTPRGRVRASEYRFPYADDSVDVVFMTSVCTHLLPADVENYLAETRRVLKPQGRCLITYLLLNPDSLSRCATGAARWDFAIDHGVYRSAHELVPEITLAYDEEYILSLYRRHGFEVTQAIERGAWLGIENPRNFQDVIVARKQAGEQLVAQKRVA